MSRWVWALEGELAFGAQPDEGTIRTLKEAGVRVIIDLNDPGQYSRKHETKVVERQSLRHVNDETVRVWDSNSPAPISVEKLERIARKIQVFIEQGEPVFVHCMGGKGRSPTCVAAYLILTCQSLEQARAAVKAAPWAVWDGPDEAFAGELETFARKLGK